MNDSQPSETRSPAAGDSQASPMPLTPVVMVWPGRAHAQTWLLLWISFAYLIGAILPWEGVTQKKVLLDAPVKSVVSKDVTQIMTMAEWQATYDYLKAAGTSAEAPTIREVIDDRSIGLGRVVMLLCGIAMVVVGFTNIWTRRLSIMPTLLTWIEGLVILYFFTSTGIAFTESQGATRVVHVDYGSFAPIGAMFQGGLGAIGDIFSASGKLTPETKALLEPFGIGFFLTAIAQIATLLMIVLSIVLGGKKRPEPDAKAAPRPATRPMPANRRPAVGSKPSDAPSGTSGPSSDV